MKRKFKTGDQVFVIAGNDKGKSGKVLNFHGVDRIVIEGVNIRKKHMKPTQQNQKGQIIDIERPIHISNVKILAGSERAPEKKVSAKKVEKVEKPEKTEKKAEKKAPKVAKKEEKKPVEKEKKAAPKAKAKAKAEEPAAKEAAPKKRAARKTKDQDV